MGQVRWIFPLFAFAGTTIAASGQPAWGETGTDLGYLLESPLTYRSWDEPRWSRPDRFSSDLHGWQDWQQRWRWRPGYDFGLSYSSYYHFAERIPGFYNDRDQRFWSNSYGGPWYYPGSPANTRSSWLDWKPLDW